MNSRNVSKRALCLCVIIHLLVLSSFLMAQTDTTLQDFSHFGGWPGGSAIKGDHAYLIQATVLTVLDVSGTEFQRIGSLTLPEEPSDIAIQNDYAYLFTAGSDSALQVVDISDPASPELVHRIAIKSEWPVRGFVSNSHIFIVSGDTLKILDGTNPTVPTLASAIPIPTCDIFVQRQMAYIGGSDGLRILDVSDPANPIQLSFFPTGGVNGVFVQQDYAYLLGYRSAEPRLDFRVVNVADSTNPSQTDQITADVGEWISTNIGGRITVADGIAYLGVNNKLYIFDVSVPSSLSQKSVFEHAEGLGPSFQSLQVVPPYAYAAMGSSDYGFVKINVSDPENLTTAAVLIEPWDVTYLFARGTDLYTASAERLLVYDYADPQNPFLAGSNAQWPDLYRMYVDGNTLYGTDNETLHVIDVSNPDPMQELGSYAIPDGEIPRAVMAHGTDAYLLTFNPNNAQSQLVILDVTNPANITIKGTAYVFPGEGRDLFVPDESTVAYVAFDQSGVGSGLHLLNILDPSSIALLGSGQTHGIPTCIWVSDTLAYVGNNLNFEDWFIEVFNVADPSSPAQVGEATGKGLIADLEVSGQKVFASIQGGSVYQFDIEDLYDAIMLTLIAVCPSPASIYIALMYIEHMIYSFTCDGAWSPQALMASASFGVFIQKAVMGSSAVETDGHPSVPLHFTLQQNFPNPFNPETRIEFQLPQASQVRIDIFNVQGQRIRTFTKHYSSAGSYHMIWDGRDESGHVATSGVYFYQLETPNFTAVRKMLVLR